MSVIEEIRRRIEEARSRVMTRISEIRGRFGEGLLGGASSTGIIENVQSNIQRLRERIRSRVREIRERVMERVGMSSSPTSTTATVSAETVKQPLLKEKKISKSIRTAL